MITKLLCSKTTQKSLILFIFFIFSTSAFSQNEFITTWKTDNPGTSNDSSITIPTTGAGYNYDVDWDNDGTFDEFGITGNVTHDFTSAGTYTIRIQGAFPRIYFVSGLDQQKIISIDQWGTIAWTSMELAFYGTSNLVGNATDAPDLSGVTNMSSMFNRASVFNQDISSWDTSSVTTMDNMFNFAQMFNNGGQPLNWNTALVTNMSNMFSAASAFNQDISSWNTSAVTGMSGMFNGTLAFNNGGQPLNWNTSLVTNMANMFFSSAFNQDISMWDTSKVTHMFNMFKYASAFNQDIGGWITTAVINMSSMFSNNTTFNQDISAWDVSKVTTFSQMFLENTAFNNGGQPLSWNTIAATDISFMFFAAPAFNQDLSAWTLSNVTNWQSMFDWNFSTPLYNNGGVPLNWDISGLTSLSRLFEGAAAFNQDLSSWNVSNITNFWLMFGRASAYNNDGQPLNWDTTANTNLNGLFSSATAFNQDISAWNVESVTDFGFMFNNASAFNNGGQPLNWNTPAAVFMNAMFGSATVFNQNISSWDTSMVKNMQNMFQDATAFNQNISSWDTSVVENMSSMFQDATAFNQNISTWNTPALTNLRRMFMNASAFNQDIGSWNVAGVTDFFEMFLGATLSDTNYDALLIGWDAQNLKPSEAFHGGNSQYCTMAAQTARANMIDAVVNGGDNWTITDGGLFSGTCGVLGLEDNELDNILLYPNPTTGNVTIELNSDASFTLVNILGQEIEKGTFTYGDNALDISALLKGLYFLNVKTSNGSATKKIIKQ